MQTKYWIWLQSALGAGANLQKIIAHYQTPQNIYEETDSARRQRKVLTKLQCEKLEKTPIDEAEKIIATCEKNKWTIVTPDSALYPERLHTLINFPAALYVDGDLSTLQQKVMIGIVGTRQASRYALEVTRRLACDLTVAGGVVVSGGALGVDSAAHVGAFLGAGKTIAFLGNGFGYQYLRANENLRAAIRQNGALVSEYAPGTPASKHTFPIRNRLISGSSLGTVVIEAGLKSGSLITARFANEQGRDVFAIPGSVLSYKNAGTNHLLSDGVKPVFSAKDVLEEYENLYPNIIDLSEIDQPLYASRKTLGAKNLKSEEKSYTIIENLEKLSKSADEKVQRAEENARKEKNKKNNTERKQLLKELPEALKMLFLKLPEKPFDINILVEHTPFSYQEIVGMVAELEIYGAITCTAGGYYHISENYI